MNPVYTFVLLLVLAAMVGFYRLLAGPTRADRVIALDLLFAVAVVLSICAALVSGSPAFLDVAIGLSLVGFVATIAWARLIDQQVTRKEDH
ncbi:MAG: monovalent cation/H+ antiporter complex subunit F [Gammaproteobacteria bacterium]